MTERIADAVIDDPVSDADPFVSLQQHARIVELLQNEPIVRAFMAGITLGLFSHAQKIGGNR